MTIGHSPDDHFERLAAAAGAGYDADERRMIARGYRFPRTKPEPKETTNERNSIKREE